MTHVFLFKVKVRDIRYTAEHVMQKCSFSHLSYRTLWFSSKHSASYLGVPRFDSNPEDQLFSQTFSWHSSRILSRRWSIALK